jgi:hypothetical protein
VIAKWSLRQWRKTKLRQAFLPLVVNLWAWVRNQSISAKEIYVSLTFPLTLGNQGAIFILLSCSAIYSNHNLEKIRNEGEK